ncbi:MAG: arginase family protein [Chloroflexi bacterium]|nr:arginase family protein [Chloroflexota bacterium]
MADKLYLRVPLVPPGWGHGRPWGGILSRMLSYFPDDPGTACNPPMAGAADEKLRRNYCFWDRYLRQQASIASAVAGQELAVDGVVTGGSRNRQKVVAFVGVPMDIGVGYRHGSRFGPRAVREVSSQFGSGVETGFDLRDTDQVIVDLGDIEIHSYVLDSDLFRDDVLKEVRHSYIANGEIPPAWIGNIQRIENTMKWILGVPVQPAVFEADDPGSVVLLPEQSSIPLGNIFPVLIGGDHSITYPSVKAVRAAFSRRPGDFAILYFDAHPDYLKRRSGLKTTHASQARRVSDEIGPRNVLMVGIRYIEKEELEGITQDGVKFWTMQSLQHLAPDTLAEQICDYLNQQNVEHLYISVDIDVLDASVVPGTGGPEPGGMQTRWLVDALHELGARLQRDGRISVEALDVVETAPDWDIGQVTALAAVKVILEGIGCLYPAIHEEQAGLQRDDGVELEPWMRL